MSEGAREPVRRSGDHVWWPSTGSRAIVAVLAIAVGAGYLWLLREGDLSVAQHVLYAATVGSCAFLLPFVLFRWRLVLEPDELIRVFVRTERVPLREVVAAKVVPREGLVFECADGTTLSFGACGNSAWAHRRHHASRADLIARTVLRAAATARGEDAPHDYRLPPVKGLRQAAAEYGLWTAIVRSLTRDG